MALDELNPNFDKRFRFVQPELKRTRAYYAAPLDSSDINFVFNATLNDIQNLYNDIQTLRSKSDDRLDRIYETGTTIPTDINVYSIEELSIELKKLRFRIKALGE